MSADKPLPPKPPGKPSTKTSTVPLKKETVRITLRAKPGGETAAVPPPPSSAPAAPRPPAPAPAPPAPPATRPLKPPAPAAPIGAKTVPLTPASAAVVPGAPLAQPTARLQPASPPAAPGTRPLPKATVQLQPTQPVSSAPTGAIASGALTAQQDDDGEAAGLMPFAVVCLVLALAVFTIELIGSQKPFQQDKTGSPSWAVPAADYKHGNYEKVKAATGKVNLGYNFPNDLPNRLPIPAYEDFKNSKN